MGGGGAGWRIGLDLDNTLIDYDSLFVEVARQRRLVPQEFRGTKREVRDVIRLAHESGELDWQSLQSFVYGSGIVGARLAAGAREFITAARARRVELAIVSHKTRFAARGSDSVDLREAARRWLHEEAIIGNDAIPESNLFFEDTRDDKIARIVSWTCTHFIDDLEEVFSDPAFPKHVSQLLLSAHPVQRASRWQVYTSFHDIRRVLFSG